MQHAHTDYKMHIVKGNIQLNLFLIGLCGEHVIECKQHKIRFDKLKMILSCNRNGILDEIIHDFCV